MTVKLASVQSPMIWYAAVPCATCALTWSQVMFPPVPGACSITWWKCPSAWVTSAEVQSAPGAHSAAQPLGPRVPISMASITCWSCQVSDGSREIASGMWPAACTLPSASMNSGMLCGFVGTPTLSQSRLLDQRTLMWWMSTGTE